MSRRNSTLLEVARRCSVSQSTVSRVLNNSRSGRFSASDEVRERILRVAGELNYRPSFAARNLAANRTKLIAVLGMSGIWSDRVGPSELAIGEAARVLDLAGYEIFMQVRSQRHPAYDPPPLRVDGVIVAGAHTDADLKALDESSLPYVSINGISGPRGSQVLPDDARGTRLALQHLVDLGHRRIAYLDHPAIDASHPSVAERREAFREASQSIGFEIPAGGPPLLPAEVPWDSFYEPFLREVVIGQKATAVLSYSHHGAMSLLRTAHDIGLSVPQDFSLVCFNNEPVLRLTTPSISAIEVPSTRMGRVAADLLLQVLSRSEPTEPVKVKLEETLIARESSAPPGGRRRST